MACAGTSLCCTTLGNSGLAKSGPFQKVYSRVDIGHLDAAMATAAAQPTVDELEKKEEELFRTGPLSVLTTSVKSNSQVRRCSGQDGAHAVSSLSFRTALRRLPMHVHTVLQPIGAALRSAARDGDSAVFALACRSSSTAETTASCWGASRRSTATAT